MCQVDYSYSRGGCARVFLGWLGGPVGGPLAAVPHAAQRRHADRVAFTPAAHPRGGVFQIFGGAPEAPIPERTAEPRRLNLDSSISAPALIAVDVRFAERSHVNGGP